MHRERIGPYRVHGHLADGGLGTVYLCGSTDADGPRQVAVKVLHRHLARHRKAIARLLDEQRALERLQHRNIVRLHGSGQDARGPYIALELVVGCTVAELADALRKSQATLAPELVAFIGSEAAAGLQAAHECHGADDAEGILHRDISPENLLVSSGGDVKIIDFGTARFRDKMSKTANSSVVGKLNYLAPEQLVGDPIDRRTDLYALGIVLWELLVGKRLFRAPSYVHAMRDARRFDVENPALLRPGVPAALGEAIQRALSVSPSSRFADASSLENALRAACPFDGDACRAALAQLLSSHVSDLVRPREAAAARL